MARPKVLFPLLFASCAGHASAQSELITYSWMYREVLAGTNTPVPSPNGLIEPGEAVRLELSVGFTPAVGATILYSPPPGTGMGTVAGLNEILFDLVGTGSAQGVWSLVERAPGWGIGGAGSVTSGGTVIEDAAAGQLILPGQTANGANPVSAIWIGVWNPSSFVPRSVTWTSMPYFPGSTITCSLTVLTGQTAAGEPIYTNKWVPGQFGSVMVPIVPAPGLGATLLVGGMLASRRRR